VRPIKRQFVSFKPKVALISTKYSESIRTLSEYSENVHMFRELFQKRTYDLGINSENVHMLSNYSESICTFSEFNELAVS
jgi:hypothetical protein